MPSPPGDGLGVLHHGVQLVIRGFGPRQLVHLDLVELVAALHARTSRPADIFFPAKAGGVGPIVQRQVLGPSVSRLGAGW